MTKTIQVAAVALVVATVLFFVRSSLADARADLRKVHGIQERRWNNYLLAEERMVAAELFLSTGPDAINEAVSRTRGAFVAIAAAVGDDRAIPPAITKMAPEQMAVHLLDGPPGSPTEYHYRQLHDEAVTGLNAFPEKFENIEGRIRWLGWMETVLFLLTLVVGFLGAVVAARDRP